MHHDEFSLIIIVTKIGIDQSTRTLLYGKYAFGKLKFVSITYYLKNGLTQFPVSLVRIPMRKL